MSAESRCCYCEKLPLLPRCGVHGGQEARCPLCKGNLIVDRVAGVSYRRPTQENNGKKSATGRQAVIACAVAACVILLTGGAFLLRLTSAPQHKAAPIAIAQQVERPVEEPSPAAAEPVAPEERTAALEELAIPAEAIAAPMPALETGPAPKLAALEAPAPPARQLVVQQNFAAVESLSSDKTLSEMLAKVPELSLLDDKDNSWARVQEDVKKHNKDYSAYIEKSRSDLAGLPFLRHSASELNEAAAKELFIASRKIRDGLARQLRAGQMDSRSRESKGEPDQTALSVRALLENVPNSTPAAEQIFTGESIAYRRALIFHLYVSGDLSPALVRRAYSTRQPLCAGRPSSH